MARHDVLADDLAPTIETSPRAHLQFLKLKPGQKQHVTILSHTYTGGVTHYAGGHMKLHASDHCQYCQAGDKPRWYGWLHIWTERTSRAWLIQLGPRQHPQLVLAQERWATLRGTDAELSRNGSAANTPLAIAIVGAPNILPHHPEPVHIPTVLAILMDWTDGQSPDQTGPEPLKERKR